MYNWLVTVLLLASAANSKGAQVPITSYTCTQPNLAGFLDHGQCTVSGGLRTCAIKEGARPTLLSSSRTLGVYAWDSNANPFVVLDIPQGWCVRSVEMTFLAPSGIPTPSLSVHNAERLSTNTDRTMFSLVSEEGTRLVVMNLTTLARGKYLRINMTLTGRIYLREIEVFGTNDSICTHPSSAGGNPASPTTSFAPASPTSSSTDSVTPISAQVPITSYTCTQPNIATFLDHGQCTVSGGLRTCAIKEGARPALLSSSTSLGVYGWDSNLIPYPKPFVVLDIPQGWCVGSVKMAFVSPGNIPTLSLSVHSAERLSTNTDRTMFSLVSEAGTRLVVMNLTTLAHGKYLRINMTSTGRLYLAEIEVFDTNDSICTHPSSAGGDPASPTTSVTPASTTTSVTPASPTTVSSSTYSASPISITTFTTPASATPTSARPTTTSVHSSSVTTTPMSSQPSTTMTGGSSPTHPSMSTTFPRTHNAGSTDLGHSGVTSAVFFAGLLAGAALAGPAGALSVVCYHWKKKQAKTMGKEDTTSEYKEPAYDCPLQLEENPAYEAMQ